MDTMKRKDGRGRWERALFTVMGPPQVGDVNDPVPVPAHRIVDICPRCGQPRDDHEIIRSPQLTYTVCPGSDAQP